MMTLDEAIKHCEEVVEEKEIDIENQNPLFPNDIEECKKCAEEHRQLAEWLKDYKRLLEQQPCANIPFLLHKEFGCPLDECVKAYEKAIEYLRSKSRLKG